MPQAHKIVAHNVSHGFQGRYWEQGESTIAQEHELREDANGSLMPPPHFKFADGAQTKEKSAPKDAAPKPPASNPEEKKPEEKKPAADAPAGGKPPKAHKK